MKKRRKKKHYSGYYEQFADGKCLAHGMDGTGFFTETLTITECRERGLVPFDEWMMEQEEKKWEGLNV